MEVRFPARHDAFSLGGELYLPEGEPRRCVLIGGAMAVRARFYAPFAQWLARQGLAVLAFDYRGIGASRQQRSLRGFKACFHQWGENDLAGALDFLRTRFPHLPLHFIGHSAGGQLMGMIPEPPFASATFIAAGTAYWRAYEPVRSRAVLLALWYALIPLATAVRGYLPMRAFGQGEDVPNGVAREWAKWGRDPRYVFSYAQQKGGLGYVRYDGPLLGLCFPDDAYAPRSAMESLFSLYTGARKELRLLPPGPGHFGFFKKPELWPGPLSFLTAP